MALLEVRNLEVFYGQIQAIKGISFDVEEGQIVTLIGANGAGKTTTMKTMSGVRPVKAGTVKFRGEDITNAASHHRVGMGLCQAPEGRGIFPGMSVKENLEMGMYLRKDSKSPEAAADLENVLTLFPRLKERYTQAGGSMSGRAIHGFGPDVDQPDIRDYQADQPAGHDGFVGRAERLEGVEDCQSRICSGDGFNRQRGPRPCTSRRSIGEGCVSRRSLTC
jgi:predicted ABC-type transport system involved in lysophospholipase L1 biosynthesis ATPase subunit